MSRDIKKYVFSCQSCQRNKAMNQQSFGQLQSLAISKERWERVAMDFIVGLPTTTAGYDSIIVFIDRLTKRAYFKPAKFQITAVDTATIFFETIFRHRGLPRIIISDRDPKFTSLLTYPITPQQDTSQTATDFLNDMQQNLEAAQNSISNTLLKQAKYYNKKRQAKQFQVGDCVLLNTKYLTFKFDEQKLPRKLRPKYLGPFKIVNKLLPLVYELDLPQNLKIHPIINTLSLRPFVSTPEEFQQRVIKSVNNNHIKRWDISCLTGEIVVTLETRQTQTILKYS
ncbi:unnamed protein product [Didymodactylos carnosus]|uniref:Integrase catalytic domain-containing protein n=1 Tax=Didymodactylos carnosus TaxID=1234261 RepID=A0A814RZ39_9BILA|nr:unnamed protein product [Didymodactylos carnosus]CAF1140916.1 unnamed protein product [Didymodactylos carnosus]CAF3843332.1 unnamed protein product [Didymodactylos carnosus]CAF3904620.1 unnamed protein product [Didymodactylos carnosus]